MDFDGVETSNYGFTTLKHVLLAGDYRLISSGHHLLSLGKNTNFSVDEGEAKAAIRMLCFSLQTIWFVMRLVTKLWCLDLTLGNML